MVWWWAGGRWKQFRCKMERWNTTATHKFTTLALLSTFVKQTRKGFFVFLRLFSYLLSFLFFRLFVTCFFVIKLAFTSHLTIPKESAKWNYITFMKNALHIHCERVTRTERVLYCTYTHTHTRTRPCLRSCTRVYSRFLQRRVLRKNKNNKNRLKVTDSNRAPVCSGLY